MPLLSWSGSAILATTSSNKFHIKMPINEAIDELKSWAQLFRTQRNAQKDYLPTKPPSSKKPVYFKKSLQIAQHCFTQAQHV